MVRVAAYYVASLPIGGGVSDRSNQRRWLTKGDVPLPLIQRSAKTIKNVWPIGHTPNSKGTKIAQKSFATCKVSTGPNVVRCLKIKLLEPASLLKKEEV